MPEIPKLTPADTSVDVSQFAAHDMNNNETGANPQSESVQSETITTPGGTSSSRLKTKSTFLSKKWQKILVVVGVILLVLGSVGGIMGFYTYSVVQQLKIQGKEAEVLGRGAYDSFKGQNLPQTEQNLKQVQAKLGEMRQTYNKLAFYKFIPIASSYYNDGVHGLNAADSGMAAALKSVEAVTPYADVLGFSGEGSFTGGTAEDRLKLVLQTLDKVAPVLDNIAGDLKVVESELAQINENRYPENFRGTPVRSYLVKAKEGSKGAVTALTEYRPVLEQLPAIMGGRGERKKYLILFQNDNELRPTGGFLTAYSIIYIEDGKVTPEKSDDIYELDKKFNKNIPIPEALGRYLTTEKYWNLRDMNISPDMATSMGDFVTHYKEVRGEPQDIDGIITVDTHVLVDLLTVLGPVEVPGYGTFSAETDPQCDCAQVVYALSQIITRPTPYLRTDRKGILGPMMRAILTKAYGAPRQQWPTLFEKGLQSMASRHTQMYFFDPEAQKAAETINAAGRMVPVQDSDFLAIVDANLGGAKSNLFINYDVKQEVSAPENGVITKTVEITYKNSRHGDNCNLEAGLLCLNATLRDWSRLYLPQGSKLVQAQGFTTEPKQYEEAGFAVIDGFFILEPNSQAKVKVTYTVPYTNTETYKVKLWKQGGISPFKTLLDVNGSQEEVLVDSDKTVEIKF
jgi:hypothetical protein